MKKVIIILCTVFAAVCAVLTVVSPDYLSMIIVVVMTLVIAAGFVFGIIPNMLFCAGLKQGQKSVDRVREVRADNVWTAVTNIKPFFKQKKLDDLF